MLENPTTVHISLSVAMGAFAVSALSLVLGFVLIEHGTAGPMSLELKTGMLTVNFYAFVPGLGFALFGAFIAWKAVDSLIKKS